MSLIVLALIIATAPAAPSPVPSPESLFHGDWQLTSSESGNTTGTLQVDGREFRAVGVNGTYEGTITVRTDTSPAQIDFTIRSCNCKYKGETSAGIFYEEAGGLVLASAVPGEPRPESFDDLDPAEVMVQRATRPVSVLVQ
jgi:uncharacterized protein (TIGR03067 family)